MQSKTTKEFCRNCEHNQKLNCMNMNAFREKYKQRIGESYIIHPRNLAVKEGITCIPPYMTMML